MSRPDQIIIDMKAGFASPVGRLTIWQSGDAITRLDWNEDGEDPQTTLLVEAVQQLDQYFSGARQAFDLPVQIDGSAFQKEVCQAIAKIPFGVTRTYGEIAQDLGASAQAIGRACGGNPVPIIIPCHRVMGANGRLTGFSGSGGVETKIALLRHEHAAGLLI